MDKACIIYCVPQTEGEIDRLKAVAADHGHTIATNLKDHGTSVPGQGAGYATLVRMVGKGSVRMVIVPTLTVLGSGLDDLVKLIGSMAEKEVGLIAVAEGIDTTQPDGRRWMASIASLQQYQIGLRHRKARAGQLRARESGTVFGRPKINPAIIGKVQNALRDGAGVRMTAKRFQISAARVAVEKRAMANAENSL
jgi:DNA invertase Pin-like site-specific DNA recombinase